LCPVLQTTMDALTVNSVNSEAPTDPPPAPDCFESSSYSASVPFKTEGAPSSWCSTESTMPGRYLTPASAHRFNSSSRRRRRHTWPYGRPKPIPPAGSESLNQTSASSY